MLPLRTSAFLALLAAPWLGQRAIAQSTAPGAASPAAWDPQAVLRNERFVKPPADIERLVMTPRVDISFTAPSPDQRWFLRATIGGDAAVFDDAKAKMDDILASLIVVRGDHAMAPGERLEFKFPHSE